MNTTNKTSQTPARGIMLINEWKDCKVYHVECECTDPDHAHTLSIEVEEGVGVVVNIFTISQTAFWRVSRWKLMWELLTTGSIKHKVSLVMNEQQAVNYSSALNNSLIHFKNKEG